jgi:radical SAM superfamily enzyme YgiQ (UPF0313 family)
MKVLLVNPPRFEGIPVGREDRCENTVPNIITPTGLVILGGLLEQRHEVGLIDANGYDLHYDQIRTELERDRPDFLVFKATPETFYSDLRVASLAKKVDEGIRTIMICWSLRKIAKQVLQKAENVDYYTTDYNYERPVSEICDGRPSEHVMGCAYRSTDGVMVNPPTQERFDFNSLPMPAWHLIPDFSVYWVQAPSIRPCVFVESMKGCGMTCAFCTIAGIRPSFRAASKVVDELEYLCVKRNVKYINFFDATFNITESRVLEVCDEILRRNLRGLRWFANIRADRLTEEEARLMKWAGCEGVSVGVESGSQKVLDAVGKRLSVKQAKTTIEILKKAGIKQYVSLIVGLPGENLESLSQTRDFLLDTNPTGFQVNSFVPYPSCELYDVAVQEGKIDSNLQWENLHLFNTPISLCELTQEEINEYRRKLYRDVYFSSSWWLANLQWVLRNPSDLAAGVDYAVKVARRLLRGMNSEI